MFLAEFLTALFVALLVSLLFVYGLGWERPARRGEDVGGALLFFFLVVFLLTWAGGAWLTPFGPHLFGVPILGFALVALLVALLLAATSPPPPRRIVATEPPTEAEAAAAVGLSMFFWILIGLALAAVLIRYLG